MSSETKLESLFRKQAVDSVTNRFGSPVKLSGIGGGISALILLSVALCAGIFLMTASLPRRETASGTLVPSDGLFVVSSQRTGVVSAVYAREGDFVRKGSPIFRVSSDAILENGERMSVAMKGLLAEQSQVLRKRSHEIDSFTADEERRIADRLEETENQIVTLRKSLGFALKQADIANQTALDLQGLAEQQIISRLQYRDAISRSISTKQNVTEIELRFIDLKIAKKALLSELKKIRNEKARNVSGIESELLIARERAIEYKASSEVEIISPQTGQIASMRIRAGNTVQSGKTLAVIVPAHSELLAEIWVPSSSIAFVKAGTRARLMYDAFPYQKFGSASAKVIRVAQSPTQPEDLPLEVQSKESRYRVLLVLDRQFMFAYGKKLSLTPGMRLKADLVLENRTAMDWFLEPILAITHR